MTPQNRNSLANHPGRLPGASMAQRAHITPRSAPCDCERCRRSRKYLSPGAVTPCDYSRGIMPTRPGSQPDAGRATEAAYRRGCHQSLALICDMVLNAMTLAEAKDLVRRAELIGQELREDRTKGNGCLLDVLGAAVRSGKLSLEPDAPDDGGPIGPVTLDA